MRIFHRKLELTDDEDEILFIAIDITREKIETNLKNRNMSDKAHEIEKNDLIALNNLEYKLKKYFR